ncbi:MAG: N-acetylmuramic acid 6-phosphate etherase [Bacteriovoracaceae bacterium]|jgi:N-acetylmuramic acid 6-phosphate etherase
MMTLTKKEYLKYQDQFRLGELTTESLHKKSLNLSTMVNKNILEAIQCLKEIDSDALNILKKKSKEIYQLQKSVQLVLARGDKVYLSGCGATGRLALSLETIFRQKFNSNQVVGFMAGGDFALIRSVESFEDNFSYGKRQLLELGFGKKDLLLSITEGGETSFVIGTAEQANVTSKEKPYFIYCNPDEELSQIERSQNIISSNKYNKINLCVGAMGISGSTRMQATTVQMIAVGFALLYSHESESLFNEEFESFINSLQEMNLDFLENFIEKESKHYKEDGIITYRSHEDIAITLLTDTTERSPTFSLFSFENSSDETLSLSYLTLKEAASVEKAWELLLKRKPRCLNWKDLDRDISERFLNGFDISPQSIIRRSSKNKHLVFDVDYFEERLLFQIDGIKHSHQVIDASLFKTHMMLKMIMNIHSTLVMGLLGRFEGNMMTYVRPSNFKLIDRAKRYIINLLEREGIIVLEEKVVDLIFENLNAPSQSIVYLVVKEYKKISSDNP